MNESRCNYLRPRLMRTGKADEMNRTSKQIQRARKRLWSNRKGAALPLIMTATAILLVVGTGLLSLSLYGRTLAIRTGDEISARCAADAGLVEALSVMNARLEAGSWYDSELPEATDTALANCEATYSYTVEGDAVNGYTIEALGDSGRAQSVIRSGLRLQGLFEYAVFGKESVQLKYGGLVDWYNFDADDGPMKVGTSSILAGAVALKNGATINGDCVVGVNGSTSVVIDLKNGATITGLSYAMSEEQWLPSITVPGWLASMPSGGTIKNNTNINSSGKYDQIDLKNSRVVTVNGDVTLYVIGDVILGNSAQIQIGDSGSSLVLYIGGNYEGKNGSALNNKSQDPTKLKILALDTCTNMVFKNSSELYGAIYAPNADITFNNSAAAYGSVVGKTFEQKNSGDFHYDAALRDASIDDEVVRFVVNRWQEN